MVPYILKFSIKWRQAVSFTLQQLYSFGRSIQYPLNNRMGGPQSQFGYFGEKQNLSSDKNQITILQMSSL
jgi:hypothetical protein